MIPEGLPRTAKRVFKGVLFDVYQWNQRLYDGSSATFERVVRKQKTVSVIATVGDKIITLVEEQPGRSLYPAIPGGAVEDGETVRDGAKRELLEESGYRAASLSLFIEGRTGQTIFYHDHVFIARNCKYAKPLKLDPGERIAVRLSTFEEFLGLCRNPKFTPQRDLRIMMYEALFDSRKRAKLRKEIFG